MAVSIYKNDLPQNIELGTEIAVDTETMGLKFGRDRLCLVQLADIKGTVCLIQIDKNQQNAPNLAKLMTNEKIVKIFHYARFDIGVLHKYLHFMASRIHFRKL